MWLVCRMRSCKAVGALFARAVAWTTVLYRNDIVPIATILTPNQFEAQLLSGVSITDMDTAWAAVDVLHARGPQTVIITSTDFAPASDHTMYMLVSCPWGMCAHFALHVSACAHARTRLVYTTLRKRARLYASALASKHQLTTCASRPLQTVQTACRMCGIACSQVWIAVHAHMRASWSASPSWTACSRVVEI